MLLPFEGMDPLWTNGFAYRQNRKRFLTTVREWGANLFLLAMLAFALVGVVVRVLNVGPAFGH